MSPDIAVFLVADSLRLEVGKVGQSSRDAVTGEVLLHSVDRADHGDLSSRCLLCMVTCTLVAVTQGFKRLKGK